MTTPFECYVNDPYHMIGGKNSGAKFKKLKPTLFTKDFVKSIAACIRVLNHGADKHGRFDWTTYSIRQLEDAAERHRMRRLLGEENDWATGEDHIIHEVTNLLMMYELYHRGHEHGLEKELHAEAHRETV